MDQNQLLGLMALRDGFGSLRSMGGGPAGPQNALPMALQYKAQQAEQERLQQALQRAREGGVPAGVNPAAFDALGSVAPGQALQMLASPPPAGTKPPASVQEYNFAREQGFQGTFRDWITAKAEAGRTQINNNVNTSGGQKKYDYGPVSKGYRRNLETGEEEIIPGGPVAREGEQAAETTLTTTQGMIDSINGVLNDPALPYATGFLEWTQAVPGTGSRRFKARADQLKGQAFLQAFDSLKGGGQITQIEGEKATAAIGRLDTAQDPEDYQAALNDLLSVLEGVKARASGGLVNANQTAGPQGVVQAGQFDFTNRSDDDLRRRLQELGVTE